MFEELAKLFETIEKNKQSKTETNLTVSIESSDKCEICGKEIPYVPRDICAVCFYNEENKKRNT